MKRSALTGTSLDMAWTSIPVFERVYGAELRRRKIVPPARTERTVSGAAGGTILDPVAGIFDNVLVFDFRSLYPSIMRSFNIDPLARARALSSPRRDDIVAPNGARFSREEGIMPSLIRRYAAERERFLDSGDDSGAYVLKILQNSFYGVLGSAQCAYARTDLAGAITSLAREFLHASRDWFESGGRRVLYGDTDSVFVQASFSDGSGFETLSTLGRCLAASLDERLSAIIRSEYGLQSFLKMRCEKVYGRFLIPRLRQGDRSAAESDGAGLSPSGDRVPSRGRAKGYAGLELTKEGARIEIKGMEAARSDWTPLARNFQTELIGLAFSGRGFEEARDFCRRTEAELKSGRLDGDLVYRKRLRRSASAYASGTPQVLAARLLGWTTGRGVVAYVMTVRGPRPDSLIDAAIDYAHYLDRQLKPIAFSVAGACGWDPEGLFADSGQIGFDFG
jgi:DNA polymerase-2